MKLLYLSLFMLLYPVFSTSDEIDKVTDLLGKGNTHEIAKLFSPNVELTLMDEANTYSKAQAELILEKFFAQNKPAGSKVLHKVNSNANFHFGVAILNTDKGQFRAAFTLKDVSGSMQLIELRIEGEKVK